MTEPPAGPPPAESPSDPQPAVPAPPPYGSVPPGAYPPAPAYGQPPPGMYYDPMRGLSLPQGVVLASIGRRVGAYFLSFVLAVVTLGIGYVIWGLVIWSSGRTPALQVLGMRCWQPDVGRVPGFWRMALREVIGRLVEGILSFITLIVSFVMFLSSKDHKSLHDAIAGTVVVHDPNGVLG